MIGYADLKELLTSYGIDYTKVITKNDNVIEYGEYREIKGVLDYLIGELKIIPKSIEKCPSILYFNVGAIKDNYEFLKSTPITISNINNCLHILNTDPIELRKTYEYILNNYGIGTLNRQTSILSRTVDNIKKYEYNFKDIMSKEALLSAIIGRKDINEIEKIVLVCKKYNIEITGSVFLKNAREIEKIVSVCRKHNIEIAGNIFLKTAKEIEKIVLVCKKYNIEIVGSVFHKTAEEIEKIVLVCQKYNIEITGNVFHKTAEEIEKIVLVCKKYNIEITGSVFHKTAKEIEEIVLVCESHNIEITGGVFSKTAEEIEKIVLVCKKNNIKITGSVFQKTAEEIEKIILVCQKHNIEIIGNIFSKTAEEIEKIILLCESHNIEITRSCFHKTPKEVERIVLVCQKYNVKITGSVFFKTADELEETCNYIKSKYGDVYLKSLIVNKSKKNLEKVFQYLEELGVLPIVINSASILTLKLEEIIERKSVLDIIGEPMVKNNKFNSIFGLSRKNYQKKLEELNIKLDDIRGRKV